MALPIDFLNWPISGYLEKSKLLKADNTLNFYF